MDLERLCPNLTRMWAALAISECKKASVAGFYTSPGMRNAPLLANIIYLCNDLYYSGMDERAQAYRALGAAKASGKPSVLICTSGTAMANYLPAIIEAKKSNIPLIVLTADRPVELTHSDANQTIDQTKVLNEWCACNLNLEAPSENIRPRVISSLISKAIETAKEQMAPVHINMPFREPLDQTYNDISDSIKFEFFELMKEDSTYTSNFKLNKTFNIEILETLINAKNPLIVVGRLNNNDHHEAVKFLKKQNCNKYIDVASSVKFEFSLNDHSVPSFDHPEVFDYFVENKPDAILFLGGRITGKHFYRYLEEQYFGPLIQVNDSNDYQNPSHYKVRTLNMSVDDFSRICNTANVQFKASVKNTIFSNFTKAKRELIEAGPITYPLISKTIVETLFNREKKNLFIANSTIIRSFDSFIHENKTVEANLYTNRGVSGIEGMIATVLGISDARDEDIILITGDVSLFHDLNSLHYMSEHKRSIKVILVNNKSGGIFTLLPISKESEIIHTMTTPHNINFKKICESFDIEHSRVETPENFKSKLSSFIDNKTSGVLEILVDPDKNQNIYKMLRTVKM